MVNVKYPPHHIDNDYKLMIGMHGVNLCVFVNGKSLSSPTFVAKGLPYLSEQQELCLL